jgi:putative nucleotidyltransferase with HDIG domain/PAS domain S-box-containing protein
MEGLKDRIRELEADINRLKEELQSSKERERALEETRKGMLYLLEDLNESTQVVLSAKKEWEETFDAIKDPIFIHDMDFRLMRVNRAYQEAAGMPFNQILGRTYYEVFPRMEGPFEACLKYLEKEEEGQEEIFLPDTDRTFSIRLYPMVGEDGRYICSIHIMEDITEAKRSERELERSLEKIWEEKEVNSNLLMISDATTHTTDIDRLLEEVLRCVHRIMGFDVGLSYLWDGEPKVLRPAQSNGLAHGLIPFFKTEPLDEKVPFVKSATEAREAVIYSSPDSSFMGSALQWTDNVNTIVVIPLSGKFGYLGLILGLYAGGEPPVFRDREKRLMKGISQQVSVALEEARSYKQSIDRTMELSHKIETIEVMQEIDRAVLSSLEPREILETSTRMIAKVVPCDRATVALVDRENEGFTYEAGFGITFLAKGTFVRFEDTDAMEVLKTGRAQYAADLTKTNEPLTLEKGLIKEGFLSHIRVPIVVKGEVSGILSVGAKRLSAFGPEDLSTVEKISDQIAVALENARLVTDLEELFLGTVRSLSEAIDAKSRWTAGHSRMVTETSLAIGSIMGLDEKALKELELSGLLHDIGKIGTYEGILDKPGKLTPEELALMREHPAKGAEILAPIKQMKEIIPTIRHHHEHHDGRGYPEGLKGEEIPPFARIIAVADTVDAMGSDRPYRKGLSTEAIIAELKRCSGTQFDPEVVDAFLKVLETKGGEYREWAQ